MSKSINIPTPGHPPYCEIYLPTETTAARFDDGFISFGASAISNPTYYVEDLLGSSRLMTTNNGTVCYDADFDPYGGEHPYTNTCSQNYKFEGKERDTETGNDDFGARYYTSRFGRWLSADWSSVPVPVPYANLTNPQTLNLYAMVSDDPESFADLDGHITNASQGSRDPMNGGPTCAAGGAGGTGSANSASCGAGQTANQTEDQQQAEATKQQAQNQQQPKPEIVIVVTSDTRHPVIMPGSGTTVTEREVVYTVEEKNGDKFTRPEKDHEISLQEVQTGGNEKPRICTPCKATNQIDDGMHVGGPGKTHTVQKEFYVDGKRTPVYGPAWRDKNGKPIPVIKLQARADEKKVDLVPIQ